MSGNSVSQGPSGMATPWLKGYTVTRDGEEWVARHNTIDLTLRGRNQEELDNARAAAVAADVAAIQQRFAETDPSGYPRAAPAVP